MVEKGIMCSTRKDLGKSSATDITSTDGTDPESSPELHYAKRGERNGRTLLTAEEEERLLRKIDWQLMALCSIIFMFKNLDSNNLSNARIMNKGTDQNIMTQLGISSNEYNLVTALYYAEAGQFPGVILQMTYWYRPDEMSLRLLYFCMFTLNRPMYRCGPHFSAYNSEQISVATVPVSSVVSLHTPLTPYLVLVDSLGGSGKSFAPASFIDIQLMQARLFLIEGIVTVIYGVAIWFLLPDFPETANWLTEKEKKFIQARLPANAPRASEENFNLRELLNIPITACGLRFIAITGITADRSRIPRPLYPFCFLLIILICYGVFVAYPSIGAVYAVTLIGNALTAGWYPVMWPWRVQTTSRATGSAFSIGFVNSYGQIGGAIGPQLFRSSYAPRYIVPFSVAMGLVGACAILTLVTWWVTWDTERDTRRLKLAKIAAEKRGETLLENIVDRDLKTH
ncbi:hypothetical protein N7488_010673 [Penicillium malachiteum]|nr:hypothetical protein N7488_010673 [Penicillium malachiteum]